MLDSRKTKKQLIADAHTAFHEKIDAEGKVSGLQRQISALENQLIETRRQNYILMDDRERLTATVEVLARRLASDSRLQTVNQAEDRIRR